MWYRYVISQLLRSFNIHLIDLPNQQPSMLSLPEAASQVSKEHSGQSQTKGLSNSQLPVVKMEWPSTNSKQTLKLVEMFKHKKPEKHMKFLGNITATPEMVKEPPNTKIISGSVRFSHPHIIITWAEIWNMRLFWEETNSLPPENGDFICPTTPNWKKKLMWTEVECFLPHSAKGPWNRRLNFTFLIYYKYSMQSKFKGWPLAEWVAVPQKNCKISHNNIHIYIYINELFCLCTFMNNLL